MEAWVGFYSQSVGTGRSENRPKFDILDFFLAIFEAKSCIVHCIVHFLSVSTFFKSKLGFDLVLHHVKENGEFHDFLLTPTQKC